MPALHLLFHVRHHIVTQIVKPHLVVGAVGDVRGVGLAALLVFFFVNNQTHGQAEKTVHLTHPLAVAAGKIIVDRDNMNALARKRVEIRGQGRDESFAFPRFHLGDAALMQHNATNDLHREVLHVQNTPRGLAAGGKRLGQKAVEGFAVGKALPKFGGFGL